MNKIFSILIALATCFFLTGCLSKALSLGENKTYCEENGCDYTDAGVCKDPYFVLQNKHSVKKNAYKNIDCFTNKGE